jgi:hypothetical protein
MQTNSSNINVTPAKPQHKQDQPKVKPELARKQISVQTQSKSESQNPYPKLWEIGDDGDESNITNKPTRHMPSHIIPGSEESFSWARSVPRAYLRITDDTTSKSGSKNGSNTLGEHRTFLSIVSTSLVIAQEFAMSTLFLSAHRCLVCVFDENKDKAFHDDTCLPCQDVLRISTSTYIFGLTFPIISFWSIYSRGKQVQAEGFDDTNKKDANSNDNIKQLKRQRRRNRNRTRVFYRSIDAFMIAAMLRFLSSVLRTLTASYSSDTVMALAVGGMILHLLSCDYNFASGILVRRSGQIAKTNVITYEHGRPLFMGGTIAINSVFFSAVLLASRFSSDSSTYTFLMATVVLFAYYPEARHITALTFGNAFGKLKRDDILRCIFQIGLNMNIL